MSVAEFLVSEEANARVVGQENGWTVIRGDDPFADEFWFQLWLDPSVGYRPREIELFWKKGLLSRFEVGEYLECQGAKGRFWFPKKGVWLGGIKEDGSFDTRNEYQLREIEVDRRPDRSEFVLTYPKGTLVVNTDTGESGYLTEDATVQDAPLFGGKLMSLEEHDRLLAEQESAKGTQQRRGIGLLLGAVAVAALCGLLLWLLARRVGRAT